MSSRLLSREQALTLLKETPTSLDALTSGLAPAQLRTAPTPGAWSANEVLAHLRACADVWGDCIVGLLTEDAPTLRAINPRTWIKTTKYHELAFGPSLDAFTTKRAALLAILEPLPPAGWSRTATVTGAGRVLEQTVFSYAQR